MNRNGLGDWFMMGKLYAVGVGPGDPQLLTLKAVKVLQMADVIACPAKGNTAGVAYGIAKQACPELAGKETLLLTFPMEKGDLSVAHQKAAENILSFLQSGKEVAFLTLGDPCFYSTFSYIADILKKEGIEMEIINGIPSFCGACAKLLLPVVTGDEAVQITSGEYRNFEGTLIIMKAGNRLKELKEKIALDKKSAYLVENCGMAQEKVYSGVASMPDQTGYFSILIVKD
jgi:precorrin-2/cobalt-factor-2 C20-methyltransferase